MKPYPTRHFLLLLVTGIISLFLFGCSALTTDTNFPALRVAHAGGGIDNKDYTNSLEALNYNLSLGYEYFEIDLSFTSDDQLVCMRDWDDNFRSVFDLEPSGAVSLAEFEHLVETRSEYTLCTLETLVAWLIENPSTTLITDVKTSGKEANLAALELFKQQLPDFAERVIPQIYQPENFTKMQEMGFEQVIWTLYLYGGSTEEVLEWVDRFDGSFAITMPRKRASTILPTRLEERAIPTYVHTLNSVHEVGIYSNYGISEIYTDFLSPEQNSFSELADQFFTELPVTDESEVVFNNELELKAYNLLIKKDEETGMPIADLHLQWESLLDNPSDHTVFVHFYDMDGSLLGQLDKPVEFNFLEAGDTWPESMEMPITLSKEVETIEIMIGLYDWPSTERLNLPNSINNTFHITTSVSSHLE